RGGRSLPIAIVRPDKSVAGGRRRLAARGRSHPRYATTNQPNARTGSAAARANLRPARAFAPFARRQMDGVYQTPKCVSSLRGRGERVSVDRRRQGGQRLWPARLGAGFEGARWLANRARRSQRSLFNPIF